MFKAGREVRLRPSDLKRFGRRFETDLEALMPGRNCRLVTLSDWGSDDTWLVDGSLLLPMVFRGRDLGYLRISPAVPGDDEKFIRELMRQGLETMWLRKAMLTDRETGLFSRDYFGGRLLRALRRRRRRGAAMNLSLDEEASPELILVIAELRGAQEAHLALPEFVARLNLHLNLKYPARSGIRQLAFLVEGKPDEIRLNLEAALDDQVESAPATRPIAAWVRWPYDLGREEGDGPTQLRLQAHKLWEMAETTLFYARQSRGSAVGVAFGDLVGHYGQLTQVLPTERVIINLGRATGAAPGQVFLVSSPVERPSAEPQYKGEITIFEVQENYSLAHVSGLKTPLRLVAGDRLSFSRNEYDSPSGPIIPWPDRALPGFLTTLPNREDFLVGLTEISRKPLALALARFDGYGKACSLMGREEGDKALAFVFEKVMKALPPAGVASLWLPDTLALAWPNLGADELKPTVEALAAELRGASPVSFGLLFSQGEEGEAEWLLADARKALNEAAFYGSGQLAVFGALALNISGDRLFESGDIDGAINEYERGLEINPDDLNLLNSLGVCYGRLGSSKPIDIFEKVISLDSGNMMAHYNLGYTYLLAGRMHEAEEMLSRAAELAPGNFEALFHFGKTALELGHLDRALPALKKAATLENARPGVHRMLGEALMLTGDHKGALSAFKKAVKATPNDAYILSTLGVLFVDQTNDLPVARSLFLKSVEIDPTNSLYRQRLGRLLFSLNEFGEAEHHLKMAVEYGGPSPELNYQLGCLAEDSGRDDEALAYFRAALEEDPAYQPALEKVSD